MFPELFRFEIRYHTRQLSFVTAAILFALFGFVLSATAFGPENVHLDSPYTIFQSVGLLSLSSVFALAAFCSGAVVRDREMLTEEIVYATPVTKRQFLGARFLGAVTTAFVAFSFSIPGMILGRFVPSHDPARLGSFQPTDYLYVLLVLGLPNILFAGIVLFSLATFTRSAMASYGGAVGLYVFYLLASTLTRSPLVTQSRPGRAGSPFALLDPFGLAPFFSQTQYWTVAERNTNLAPLTGPFLLNRLLVIVLSVVGLALVIRLFEFRLSKTRGAKAAMPDLREKSVDLPRVVVTRFDSPGTVAAFFSTLRIDCRTFLLSIPFLSVTLLWVGLAATEIRSAMGNGEYGAATYPITSLLYERIESPLLVIGLMVVIYFSGEMVWRDRVLRVDALLHSSPAPSAMFVFAKFVALSLLCLTLSVAGVMTGVVIQLLDSYPPDLIGIVAITYALAAPLVLLSAAAVLIQILSPQKYAGMLATLLFILLARMGEDLGLHHHLLRFGTAPQGEFSDMNGFAHTLHGFHWHVLYWGAAAGLLLLFAAPLWRNRTWRGLPARVIHSFAQRRGRVAAASLLLLFVATGAFIFYNTNVLNDFTTPASLADWKESFERKYASEAGRPAPQVTSVNAEIDLFPEDRRYRVRGALTLTNTSKHPIRRILVAVRPEAGVAELRIRGTRLAEADARFNVYTFDLDEPLLPGGETSMTCDLSYRSAGFVLQRGGDAIVENGSFIMTHRLFPSLGYRRSYELDDEWERRKRGLPPRRDASSEEGEFPLDGQAWTRFDMKISTAADQTVIAPGTLVSQWRNRDRHHFRYRTEGAIPNQYTIASGRYVSRKIRRGAVVIEAYFDARHAVNIDRMLDAAGDVVEYCSRSFGPYPFRELRLVEVPRFAGSFGGYAQPGVVYFREDRLLLTDVRDSRKVDLVTRRVAHEVAHQWWGHGVVPAHVAGATLITETLTKYIELIALEKRHGRAAVEQSLWYEHDRYLKGRNFSHGAEPPLLRSGQEPWLYYHKGSAVMAALRGLLGEERLNGALRSFYLSERGPGQNTTSHDLMERITAVAPADAGVAIHEWLGEVVLHDVRMKSAHARRARDVWEVTLTIEAAKENGGSPVAAFLDPFDLALYAANGRSLYERSHRLKAGANTIVVTVPSRPATAALDPHLLRIDRSRFDNEAKVQ